MCHLFTSFATDRYGTLERGLQHETGALPDSLTLLFLGSFPFVPPSRPFITSVYVSACLADATSRTLFLRLDFGLLFVVSSRRLPFFPCSPSLLPLLFIVSSSPTLQSASTPIPTPSSFRYGPPFSVDQDAGLQALLLGPTGSVNCLGETARKRSGKVALGFLVPCFQDGPIADAPPSLFRFTTAMQPSLRRSMHAVEVSAPAPVLTAPVLGACRFVSYREW